MAQNYRVVFVPNIWRSLVERDIGITQGGSRKPATCDADTGITEGGSGWPP
jgi:hypothetical protein